MIVVLSGTEARESSAKTEIRLVARYNPVSSEERPLGGLFGIGYVTENKLNTVGMYGFLQTSDQDLPVRMRRMFGPGIYAERSLLADCRLTPFIGGSAGILRRSGTGYDNAYDLAGTLGLKYSVTEAVILSLSGSYHWCNREVYNYDRTGDSWEADRSEETIDAGVRFLF